MEGCTSGTPVPIAAEVLTGWRCGAAPISSISYVVGVDSPRQPAGWHRQDGLRFAALAACA